MDTLTRFDRIVAILIQLQSKKVVRAQDLADRFQVSLRTVYRDIRSLESAGVPIVSEPGTGYSIMDGYRLPPVMFSREEAGSFVAAEKLMAGFTDKMMGEHYSSAMFKIKSVLRGAEKDWVEALEAGVDVRPSRALFNQKIPNALEILFESIADKKAVRLLYRSFQAESPLERIIEPAGVFHEHNYWYVMAFCRLRNDYRQFRTDRILEIMRTDMPFIADPQPADVFRGRKNGEKHLVRIAVDKKFTPYMQESRRYHGFVSEEEKDGCVEMRFMTSDPHVFFARWFLMYGDGARILEPESLKETVRSLVARIQERVM